MGAYGVHVGAAELRDPDPDNKPGVAGLAGGVEGQRIGPPTQDVLRQVADDEDSRADGDATLAPEHPRVEDVCTAHDRARTPRVDDHLRRPRGNPERGGGRRPDHQHVGEKAVFDTHPPSRTEHRLKLALELLARGAQRVHSDRRLERRSGECTREGGELVCVHKGV